MSVFKGHQLEKLKEALGLSGGGGGSGAQGPQGDPGIDGSQGIQGSQGSQGIQGSQGSTGGWTLLYDFDTSISAPSSSGQVRFNNATVASVTHIYIHKTDRNAANIAVILAEFGVSDELKFFKESDVSVFSHFRISVITDQIAYIDFTVVYLSSNNTFSNGDNIGIGWMAVATGTLPISRGGTGQTTQITAFNALSPLTAIGDLIGYDGVNNVRVPPAPVTGLVLVSDGSPAGFGWGTTGGAGSDPALRPYKATHFI